MQKKIQDLLKGNWKKLYRSILMLAILIIAYILFLYIWNYPSEYYRNNKISIWNYPSESLPSYFLKYVDDEFKFITDKREKIIAGMIVLIGIYLTWRRTNALDKQNTINQDKNVNDKIKDENNLVLQQFSKASEFLKDSNISAKLSGIYLFEKIMNTYQEYHWTVIEILSAYVREQRNNKNFIINDFSNLKNYDISNIYIAPDYIATESREVELQEEEHYSTKINYYINVPVDEDIKAIVKVLGKRNREFEFNSEGKTINFYLNNTIINENKEQAESFYYRKVININSINFDNVIFSNVDFSNLDFTNTDFKNSHFFDCKAKGTKFGFSDLEKSIIIKSEFNSAKLNLTHLSKAFIYKSYFDDAVFSNSWCWKISFYCTSCRWVKFKETLLIQAKFINSGCIGSLLKNVLCQQLIYQIQVVFNQNF